MRKTETIQKTTDDAVGSPHGYISPDERRAAGKALRDATPRAAHGGWKAHKDRRDTIELLHEFNESRISALIPVRLRLLRAKPKGSAGRAFRQARRARDW